MTVRNGRKVLEKGDEDIGITCDGGFRTRGRLTYPSRSIYHTARRRAHAGGTGDVHLRFKE